MVNSAIEFHDSDIINIEYRDATIILYFNPAYIHKSDGMPGVDPGTGWLQEVHLIIENANIKENIKGALGTIWHGEIEYDGNISNNIIPLPLDARSEVRIKIKFNNDNIVEITGKSAKSILIDEPKYLEDFRQ